MYYPSSENEGADQLRVYREADLRLCFHISANSRFSHEAQMVVPYFTKHAQVEVTYYL